MEYFPVAKKAPCLLYFGCVWWLSSEILGDSERIWKPLAALELLLPALFQHKTVLIGSHPFMLFIPHWGSFGGSVGPDFRDLIEWCQKWWETPARSAPIVVDTSTTMFSKVNQWKKSGDGTIDAIYVSWFLGWFWWRKWPPCKPSSLFPRLLHLVGKFRHCQALLCGIQGAGTAALLAALRKNDKSKLYKWLAVFNSV